MNLFSFSSKDVGIDLGTVNTLVTIKGKGIVLKEPTIVAIDRRTKKIVATGVEANKMLRKNARTYKCSKTDKTRSYSRFYSN